MNVSIITNQARQHILQLMHHWMLLWHEVLSCTRFIAGGQMSYFLKIRMGTFSPCEPPQGCSDISGNLFSRSAPIGLAQDSDCSAWPGLQPIGSHHAGLAMHCTSQQRRSCAWASRCTPSVS